jgi:lysophospholipase L1-like esterase
MSNFGINGQGLNYVYPVAPSNTFGTLTADAVTRVDPILSRAGDKYLIIFAGTNDIFLNSTSGAATWTLLQTYINARISAGWTAANICVVTMLPRQNTKESDRTTYNGLIRSNAAGMGYKVADAGADATIGCAGCENNTTYYADTIHPTAAGHLIIQGLISAALFP